MHAFFFFRWIYALTNLFTSWQTRYLHIIRLWQEGEYVVCDLDIKSWVACSDISINIHSMWEISSLLAILVCFLINGYDQNARIRGQQFISHRPIAMRRFSSRGTCRWARPLLGVVECGGAGVGSSGVFSELTGFLIHVGMLRDCRTVLIKCWGFKETVSLVWSETQRRLAMLSSWLSRGPNARA